MNNEKNINFNSLINQQESAFTLAEVLVTLGIIGVVASMTIPSVIVKTRQTEYRTGAKKALSVITQAVKLVEVEQGIPIEEATRNRQTAQKFSEALEKKLNIVKTSDEGDYRVFYTADGFRYFYDQKDPTIFYIDVNGDKGPTKVDSDVWARVDYEDWDDLTDANWPNITLTDMFVAVFNSNGSSYVRPNTDIKPTSVPPNPSASPNVSLSVGI